jgi:hypothetical protein
VARRRVDIKVDIPLFICGETRNTRAGICIIDRNDSILLLVQPEAKRLENTVPINVHAQLVVKAIAAFNENNRRREAVGLPPLVEKVSHFRGFIDSFLMAYSPLGHARHRHASHVSRFLQNSCHRDSVNSYSSWDLSSRGNTGDVLLSAPSTSCPSA